MFPIKTNPVLAGFRCSFSHEILRYIHGFHQFEKVIPRSRFLGYDDVTSFGVFTNVNFIVVESAPSVGVPCLCFLCEKDSKSPFYIGEYGKSRNYDVVTRIKRHFENPGTLARVSNNMRAFGYYVPSDFVAYIKVLSKKYENTCNRESLEAWVIHKICHNKKTQNTKFCVTKHTAPKHDLSKDAGKRIEEFENYS